MNLELNPEQQLIRDTARDFAVRELEPHAHEWDEHHVFPREMFDKMAALGFAGMTVPEEYGGVGADTLTYILMLEEINRVVPALGTVISVHNSLVNGALLRYGSDEQKARYEAEEANKAKAMERAASTNSWSVNRPTSGTPAAADSAAPER